MDRPKLTLISKSNRLGNSDLSVIFHHFPGMQRLPEHLVIKQRRRYPDGTMICNYCGYTSKNPSNMKDHLVGKHSILQDLRCNYCPKTYKNSYALKQHCQRYHQEEYSRSKRTITDFPKLMYRSKWDTRSHFFAWHKHAHYLSSFFQVWVKICLAQSCRNTWRYKKWKGVLMAHLCVSFVITRPRMGPTWNTISLENTRYTEIYIAIFATRRTNTV